MDEWKILLGWAEGFLVILGNFLLPEVLRPSIQKYLKMNPQSVILRIGW